MPRQKYDPEQVKAAVVEYLANGGTQTWAETARTLKMAVTTLKGIMDNTWPVDDTLEVVADPKIEEVVKALKHGPKTRVQLADILDVGPSTIDKVIATMRESGRYEISERENKLVMPKRPAHRPKLDYIWPQGQMISLLHLSDLHFGSIHHQNSALRHITRVAVEEEGCRYGLVSGDVTHGIRMYRGIEYDLYAFGADEQIEAACDGLPHHEGFTWLLMGGNHDESHFKTDGTNVVRRICELRTDCRYAGFGKVDVPLMQGDTGALNVRMWHPTGGAPYAKSYRGQKGAEDATKDWLNEAVTEAETRLIVILQWGHVHYKDLFFHGPMTVLNPGCFESQNIYLAEKALTPEIGGVISHTQLSGGGWSSQTSLRWLHYRVAEDDYKPVRHTDIMDVNISEPLFVLHPEREE